MVTMEWTNEGMAEKGAVIGSWAISGETGKWKEASGGGSFASLTNSATGENANSVTGSIMLP